MIHTSCLLLLSENARSGDSCPKHTLPDRIFQGISDPHRVNRGIMVTRGGWNLGSMITGLDGKQILYAQEIIRNEPKLERVVTFARTYVSGLIQNSSSEKSAGGQLPIHG